MQAFGQNPHNRRFEAVILIPKYAAGFLVCTYVFRFAFGLVLRVAVVIEVNFRGVKLLVAYLDRSERPQAGELVANMGAPHSNVHGIATTRFPSHQLSNGLYVSGHPDQHKDRGATMGVPQMPYTGGDVKKSGELGKMFDIPVDTALSAKLKKSGSFSSSAKPSSCGASSSHSGPLLSNGTTPASVLASGRLKSSGSMKEAYKPGVQVSKSGPLTGATTVSTRQTFNSGPLTRCTKSDCLGKVNETTSQSGSPSNIGGPVSYGSTSTAKGSGPISPTLPATGLITSGLISVGPISTTGAIRKSQSGPVDNVAHYGKPSSGGGNTPAINYLSDEHEYSFGKSFPKVVFWTVIPLFLMGFIAGGFIIAAVHNSVLLIVVAALFMAVVLVLTWNLCWGSRSVTAFLARFPDSELGAAKDGQYVKVTGVRNICALHG
ncbi:hypothetical protein AXG93_3052s1140 [Marchantia polymorpha subsp. ruderalis]|uniref:Uncharacterized protein n=1 Tax=Marchantia polymorpha subsp. ruderalis TaxID=1480154 RepID=A0A176WJ33_MARPO|nr:hypothetical protein AXG93_3052s1140 [Marchantia polymorpha subsp. ruderalis]